MLGPSSTPSRPTVAVRAARQRSISLERQQSYGHTVIHDVGVVGRGGWGDWHVCLIFCLSDSIFGSVCCGYSTEEVANLWLFPGPGPSFLGRNHSIATQFKTHFIFALNAIPVIIKYGSPIRTWSISYLGNCLLGYDTCRSVSRYQGIRVVSVYFSGAHYAAWLSFPTVCGNKESESRKERSPTVSVNAGNTMKLDGLLSAMQGGASE